MPPSRLSVPLVFTLARGPSRRPCGPESARVTRIPALTQQLADVALVQAAGGKADSSVVTNGPVNITLLLGGLGSYGRGAAQESHPRLGRRPPVRSLRRGPRGCPGPPQLGRFGTLGPRRDGFSKKTLPAHGAVGHAAAIWRKLPVCSRRGSTGMCTGTAESDSPSQRARPGTGFTG